MENKKTSKEIIAKTIKANLFTKINNLIEETEAELQTINNKDILANK